MSFLVRFEILGLLVNTITANFQYSCSNRQNLQLPIQMQLFGKPKIFCQVFVSILKSTLNFEHFEEKVTLITQVFLKLLTSKDALT